jgi:hypothetical protein
MDSELISSVYLFHAPCVYPFAGDLEKAESNYEKAKAELDSTLAELGDM